MALMNYKGSKKSSKSETKSKKERALRVGDAVRLPSGGPHMTITVIHEKNAECVWITHSDGLRTTNLPLVCLKRVVESQYDDCDDEIEE